MKSVFQYSQIFFVICALVRGPLAAADTLPMDTSASAGSCVSRVKDRCVLRAEFNSFTISAQKDGAMILHLTGNSSVKTATVNIGENIAEQLIRGELVEQEATLVNAELAKLDGAAYVIPAFDEMVKTLGFPGDLYFTDEDFDEFVRIHLQMTLGIQPLTAMYLTNQMHLDVVNTREAFVQIHEEPKFESAAPLVPAPTPTPAPTPMPVEERQPTIQPTSLIFST